MRKHFRDKVGCYLRFRFFREICLLISCTAFLHSTSGIRISFAFTWRDSKFLSAGFIIDVVFSAGSVSTNGASVNSNAGQFADLIKSHSTVVYNRYEPDESELDASGFS